MQVTHAGGEWSELHGKRGHEAGITDKEHADDPMEAIEVHA